MCSPIGYSPAPGDAGCTPEGTLFCGCAVGMASADAVLVLWAVDCGLRRARRPAPHVIRS